MSSAKTVLRVFECFHWHPKVTSTLHPNSIFVQLFVRNLVKHWLHHRFIHDCNCFRQCRSHFTVHVTPILVQKSICRIAQQSVSVEQIFQVKIHSVWKIARLNRTKKSLVLPCCRKVNNDPIQVQVLIAVDHLYRCYEYTVEFNVTLNITNVKSLKIHAYRFTYLTSCLGLHFRQSAISKYFPWPHTFPEC